VAQTPAQRIINRLRKQAKRKSKDTWSDIQLLNKIVRSGRCPKGADVLGPGSGTFYQALMRSALRLRALRRRTRENVPEWDYHDERVQRLVQIARGREA